LGRDHAEMASDDGRRSYLKSAEVGCMKRWLKLTIYSYIVDTSANNKRVFES
jgi:hypothetical protein